MERELRIFDTPDALAQAAAEDCANLAAEAIRQQGLFHMALSGGSTPKRLFHALARDDMRHRLNWQHVHVYFGDERAVPPDHPDSNYRMAWDNLLSRVNCPKENIHRIEAENDPRQAAAAYHRLLQAQLPRDANGQIYFNLIFLGIGSDGHTASLFPDTSALLEQNADCCAVYVDKLQSWRITLSYPIINRSQHVWLLAEGEGKAAILRQVSQADPADSPYPINGVRPTGTYRWYLDQAAARLLAR